MTIREEFENIQNIYDLIGFCSRYEIHYGIIESVYSEEEFDNYVIDALANRIDRGYHWTEIYDSLESFYNISGSEYYLKGDDGDSDFSEIDHCVFEDIKATLFQELEGDDFFECAELEEDVDEEEFAEEDDDITIEEPFSVQDLINGSVSVLNKPMTKEPSSCEEEDTLYKLFLY